MPFSNNTTVSETNLTNSTRNFSGNKLCPLLKQVQMANDVALADFRALCAFLSSLNAFLAVIAILGNCVVFAAFYRYELLRTPSNLLLLGLSFCDILVGLVTQPLFAAEMGLVAANSSAACSLKDVYAIFLFSFSSSSMLHVCLISIERFIAIFYPFKHQRFLTKKTVVIFSILFWIAWTLLTVFTRREHGGGGLIGYSRMAFVIFSAFFILVINIRLWIEARRHSNRIQATVPRQSILEEQSISRNSNMSKAAKTTLLVIVLLMLCNLPLIATFIARKFYGLRGRLVTLLWFASNTIVLMQAILNPVIYSWRTRDIRASIKRMFGCRNTVGIQGQ